MKRISILLTYLVVFAPMMALAQSSNISGSWQLVRQGNCLDEIASSEPDSVAGLRDEMHSRSGETAQVVTFRDNATGEESTRILSKSKTANAKKFFYKFNGEMLLILDKKSQTISDSYLVDKSTSDSLVVSNASRPCETRIFLKISPQRAN
jgi:hypothetical protein